MEAIHKKTCSNTIRLFTNEKLPLKKYEDEKFKTNYFLPDNPDRKGVGGQRLKNLFKKSFKDKPLISIVTPNLKSENLEECILSVLAQEYENIEHIIIDGDSGEETIKLINKYDNYIDYWVSEKDSSLWEAWNKGLKLATGDYVGIVDSTTTFEKDAMNILIKYIKNNPHADFVFGSIRKEDKVYTGFRPEDIKLRFNIYPSCVISFFIKLDSLKKLGLYNTKYKICADYDLIYRMVVKHDMKGVATKGSEIFGSFGEIGTSKTYGYFRGLLTEIRIRFDNGQNLLIILFIFFGRCYKKLFGILFPSKKNSLGNK